VRVSRVGSDTGGYTRTSSAVVGVDNRGRRDINMAFALKGIYDPSELRRCRIVSKSTSSPATQLPTNPGGALRELRAQFSNDKMKVLVREQIESDLLKLEHGTHSFIRQLGDFLQTEVLQHDDCFQFLRHLLNSVVRRLNRKNSRRMPTCWHFAKWLAFR
jgi:hypothetical protein